MSCPTCAGAGFVWLEATSQHGAHYKRKGETERAIVDEVNRFRAPCDCPRGDEWIEARRRGKELETDDSPERRR